MNPREEYRFEVISQFIAKKITRDLVAKKLGISGRQVKRIKNKILKNGPAGLIHAARGKPSNRRIGSTVIAEVSDHIQKLYPDFKPTFAAEKLCEVQRELFTDHFFNFRYKSIKYYY